MENNKVDTAGGGSSSTKKTKASIVVLLITILSVSFVSDMSMYINPVLETIANAFPDIPYTTILTISTLPMATCMVTSFIFGFITGTKVGYRPVIAIGLVCLIVGGTAPAIAGIGDNFTLILACRAVFGCGLGMLIALNAYIMVIFDKKTASKVIGWHIAVLNIGSVIMQLLAGVLGEVDWHLVFYISLFAAVGLALVLFNMKEPEKAVVSEDKPKEKRNFQVRNVIYFFAIAIITLLAYPLLALVSGYVSDLGLGGAAISSVILSIYTLGAAVGGFIYVFMRRIMGRFIVSVNLSFIAIGLALVLFGANIPLMIIGSFITGVGFYPFLSLFCDFCGSINNEATIPLGTSLVWIGCYLGASVAAYWIDFCGSLFGGDMVTGSFVVGIIVLAVGAVLFAIVNPLPPAERKKKHLESVEASEAK